MERRFQGESLNKVDGKGRVSIPVKFRRVLQNMDDQAADGGPARLYIAYGNPNADFLECLSGNAFDEIDAMIQSAQRGSPARMLLEELYYSKCEETAVDDNGRLVLPQAAREKIGLGAEARFQGKGDKFHILNPAQDDAAAEKVEALMETLGQGNEFFDPLSLVGAAREPGPDGA